MNDDINNNSIPRQAAGAGNAGKEEVHHNRRTSGVKTFKCYNCFQEGHSQRNCPTKSKKGVPKGYAPRGGSGGEKALAASVSNMAHQTASMSDTIKDLKE